MIKIDITPIQQGELAEALDVLGKAFATQPSSLAVFKGKTDIAERMQVFFRILLEHMPGDVFVAKQDNRVVGVMRMVEWPGCQMKPLQSLRFLPQMMRAAGGLGAMRRGLGMLSTRARRDPKKPHWHLDPIGVTPDLQGQGIGSQMMKYYCEHVDELGMAAYHETERPENVGFYQRFGFEIVGRETIMDFPCWYFWRPPCGGA